MLLLKAPVPVPSKVLVLSAVVGLEEVLHTTPFAMTVEPPSAVTFPPLVAELKEMLPTAVVLTVAAVSADVVKDSSSPYAVPAELVAYALT